jgi:hypothetical protein
MSKMMSTIKCKNNVTKVDKNGWQAALEDAERGLEKALREVAEWKQAVRVCRERVKSAAPWPEEKAGTAA